MPAKQNKAIILNWQDLQNQDDETTVYVCLTQRKAALVKLLLSTAYWSTRWSAIGITPWDEIEAFVAEIDSLLSGNDCEVVDMDCDDVALCISSSDAVQLALLEYNVVNNNTGGSGNPETPVADTVLAEDLLPVEYTCDNDHRYATAVGVVDAIHMATVEVFQSIELLTNHLELASEIADNMPLISVTASPLDVVVWIQNTINEIYNAAWSEPVKDTISCEIYCLMLDHNPCHLDFDMIWQVYTEDLIDILTPPPLSLDWVAWFDWLVTLTLNFVLDATNTVKAGSLLGLLIMRYGGQFGQFVLGIRSLKTTIALLANDINPDWSILCLDCPVEWHHVWNFETHANAWGDFGSPAPSYGEYLENIGVRSIGQVMGTYLYEGVAGIVFGEQVHNSANGLTYYFRIVRGYFNLNPNAGRIRVDPYITKDWSQAYILTGDKKFSVSWDGTATTLLQCGMWTASITDGEQATGSIVCVAVGISGSGGDPYSTRNTGSAPF